MLLSKLNLGLKIKIFNLHFLSSRSGKIMEVVRVTNELVMLTHKKKEGISVILIARGLEWEQFGGPDRQGHKSLRPVISM